MPVGALGAAALGGAGVQQLWQYNRENFFFDVPLKQAQAFQEQNIALSRFALFREDVRDLTTLTLDKVQSYLIVNTLKLGFIVSVFFNFDRTAGEMPEMNFAEEQINVILCLTMGTSLFWLLTSIWLSMHTVILAQSLMTKMLLQVVRIPLPSSVDIVKAVPNSEAFERNFVEAFRLPFFSRTDRERERQRERTSSGERAQLDPARAPWARNPSRQCAADGETPAMRHQPSNASMEGCSKGLEEPGIALVSIADLVQGDFALSDAERAFLMSNVEPHVKLFKLIRGSWASYDLYGKISMELGTATMLSGLSYFSIYYFRTASYEFRVEVGGWFTFMMLTVLAWWSLILDMELSIAGHILVAALVLSPSVTLMADYFYADSLEAAPVGISIVFLLQTTWVLALCWSAVTFGRTWPKAWRASYYLNVLHEERGPAPHFPDVVKKTPRHNAHGGVKLDQTHYGIPSPDSASEDSAEVTGTLMDGDSALSFDLAGDQQESACKARLVSGPLLLCLDAILRDAALDGAEERSVQRAREWLYEASRAAGAPAADRSFVYLEAFWLTSRYKGRRPCYISPMRREAFEREDAPRMPLSDILEAARVTTETLFYDSQRWTEADMEQLARYGGEALPGVRSFLAQFRGPNAMHGKGDGASRTFRGGVCLITLMWVSALYWSVKDSSYTRPVADAADTLRHAHRRLEARAAGTAPALREGRRAVGSRELLQVPGWLAPLSLGCDATGSRLAMADSVGAFVVEANASRRPSRLRPLKACGRAAATLAADFGPGGQLWVACPDGVRRADPADAAAAGNQPLSDAGSLQALALDAAPASGGPEALAVQGGRIVALRLDPEVGWTLDSAVAGPRDRRWVAAALRGGQGLVLDDRGAVFALDPVAGRWTGPVQLDPQLQWRGLCLLPEGSWLALAVRADPLGASDATAGGPQLWRFAALPTLAEAGSGRRASRGRSRLLR